MGVSLRATIPEPNALFALNSCGANSFFRISPPGMMSRSASSAPTKKLPDLILGS